MGLEEVKIPVRILGIDPGKSGGIAWLDGAQKMPATERDLWNLFHYGGFGQHFAYIEKVHAMPGDGERHTGGSRAFNFGMNYGMLRMALIAASIPFETVTPAKWQREFKLPTLKQAGTPVKKKNAHKARAQELFPSLTITHAVADALLIAEFGRRRRKEGV